MMRQFLSFSFCCVLLLVFARCSQEALAPLEANGDGVNGSYTSILTVGDRLYYIDASTLYTADITLPEEVEVIDSIQLGPALETLFYRDDLLFVGSGIGLFILELDVAGIPMLASMTKYIDFDAEVGVCDPVVADQSYAYVTLSTQTDNSGGVCQRFISISELRVYDITDVTSPSLVSVVQLTNPKGLAVDGNLLFVCDSDNGLLVYDATDKEELAQIQHFSDLHAFDVIARNGLLVVSGTTNIAEYDYSDMNNIVRLATIEIE